MVISATFNVGDVSPYVEDEIDYGDFRANPFKGGGDDADHGIVQELQLGYEKTMLTIHHKDRFYERKQCNMEAYLGRSLLC